MSVISCPNCGLEYATNLRACPECRRPRPRTPTTIDWIRDKKNLPKIIIGAILCVLFIVFLILIQIPSLKILPPPVSQKQTESGPSADNEGAKRELEKLPWVKGTHISPGHMNVAVIRDEKKWDSPMIGSSVCGILKRFNSNLIYVRFVDYDEVVYQQKSAGQAEIYSMQCP